MICNFDTGYCFAYIPSTRQVCITTIGLTPARVWFFTEDKVRKLIQENHLNTYTRPIYQEALEQFPKEVSHEE